MKRQIWRQEASAKDSRPTNFLQAGKRKHPRRSTESFVIVILSKEFGGCPLRSCHAMPLPVATQQHPLPSALLYVFLLLERPQYFNSGGGPVMVFGRTLQKIVTVLHEWPKVGLCVLVPRLCISHRLRPISSKACWCLIQISTYQIILKIAQISRFVSISNLSVLHTPWNLTAYL